MKKSIALFALVLPLQAFASNYFFCVSPELQNGNQKGIQSFYLGKGANGDCEAEFRSPKKPKTSFRQLSLIRVENGQCIYSSQSMNRIKLGEVYRNVKVHSEPNELACDTDLSREEVVKVIKAHPYLMNLQEFQNALSSMKVILTSSERDEIEAILDSKRPGELNQKEVREGNGDKITVQTLPYRGEDVTVLDFGAADWKAEAEALEDAAQAGQ